MLPGHFCKGETEARRGTVAHLGICGGWSVPRRRPNPQRRKTPQNREGESGQSCCVGGGDAFTAALLPSCLCHFFPSWIPPISFLGKKEDFAPSAPVAAHRYQRCRNRPRGKHIWGLGSVSLPKFKLLTLFPEALGLFKQATVISFLRQTTPFWHRAVIWGGGGGSLSKKLHSDFRFQHEAEILGWRNGVGSWIRLQAVQCCLPAHQHPWVPSTGGGSCLWVFLAGIIPDFLEGYRNHPGFGGISDHIFYFLCPSANGRFHRDLAASVGFFCSFYSHLVPLYGVSLHHAMSHALCSS